MTAKQAPAKKAPAKKRTAKKRTAKKPVTKDAERPRSMVMVRIGNDDYPMVSEPRCLTCQSPHRLFIERELLRGRAYGAIAKEVAKMPEGTMATPTPSSIGEHTRQGHLPQPAITRRKIIENRAEQIGVSILGEDDLVDHITINELVLTRGYERLIEGDIEPSMGDLLNAIKLQQQIEATSDTGYDAEAYNEAMMVYFTTVQRYMEPQAFQAMLRDLNQNPILRAIRERQEQGGQPKALEAVAEGDE